jgi:cobalt/nickel transport system permease protein
VHISDGILSAPVWLGGYAIAIAGSAAALRRFDDRRIPQVAVMTSIFFVASSIPLPGPSSHLLLNGLTGLVLGWDSIPAVFLALFLQAVLLGHGGLSSLGVNVVTMAGGALAAQYLFRLGRLIAHRRALDVALGFIAGAVGVAATGFLFYLALILSSPDYLGFAELNLAAHLPLLVVESVVTGFAVSFLRQVKPELIGVQEGAG